MDKNVSTHAELIVIGAGPGGYAAAFRAADLGRSVVLVDARSSLGGVCLNEGCIPSKALLHAAQVIRETNDLADWGVTFGRRKIDLDNLRRKKDSIVGHLTQGLAQLAAKRRVTTVLGKASFTGPNSLDIDGLKWTFDQAIIAVGSSPVKLRDWPKDNRIWDSTAALELRFIPKRLVIVGGGIIGLEMATIYSALGAKVTVIELGAHIVPGADRDATKILKRAFEKSGISILLSTQVVSVATATKSLTISCDGDGAGDLTADAIIQSVGRQACGAGIAANKAGVTTNDRGEIPVDKQCRTNVTNIFAVGDVTGAPMLAHRASHQGKVAAEVASGHLAAIETNLIPLVAYTNPELAWVGLTAKQAISNGVQHKTTSFPWKASGRNLTSGGEVGLTKLVYCPDTLRLLGATIIGNNAGELLAEMVLAIELGANLEDIALSIHAHPTLSETTAFAAERALGRLTDL